MNFLIANHPKLDNVKDEFFKGDIPCICDGIEVLNSLCPVSKKTGLRENPLTLIRKLVNDPAKQALLYQFLQEMPVDNSQQNLTDQQRFELCAQRLEIGTPAENDVLRDAMMEVFENATAQMQALIKPGNDQQINFKPSDAPSGVVE